MSYCFLIVRGCKLPEDRCAKSDHKDESEAKDQGEVGQVSRQAYPPGRNVMVLPLDQRKYIDHEFVCVNEGKYSQRNRGLVL